jgi:hypothetical protein
VVLLKAWILFPTLLCLLCLGWGLLVERLAGTRLRGVLVVPLGLASIVVVSRAAMSADATAELGTPIVVAGAVAGLALGASRLRGSRVDVWAAAAAAGAFAVFAAPIVLSGTATFAGYSVLGDTAVHFVLADWLASHGSELGSPEPSSHRQTLESYLESGYPLGTHAALAAARPLAFVDVAWAFQPFLCFIAAALALTLYGLVSAVVRPGWRAAGIAFLACQPALVYAFAMQGSVKELATMWLVPLVAAFVAGVEGTVRALVPLAVAASAAIAVIGLAAIVWLGPLLLAGLWIVARRPGAAWRGVAAMAAAFAAFLCVLSIPTLVDSGEYVDVAAEVVTTESELGNLFNPLKLPQVVGIWLTGDFRLNPSSAGRVVTIALLAVAVVSAALGAVWLLRRRATGPLLFLASSLIALAYVTRAGSPWADAKGLAIAAPAVLMTVTFGFVALESRGLRVPALAVAGLVAAGVLGSNAAIYHDVSLAPADRLTELGEVGERAAGRGPLLYTEFEEFAKYFLRDADPVGAAEGFVVPGLSPATLDGGRPRFGQEADLLAMNVADVERFEAIVVRRSPAGVPPPAGYGLVWSGRYYELWIKDRSRLTSVAQEPLHGDAGPEDCRRLRALAAQVARQDGSVSGAPAPPAVELATARQDDLPDAWLRFKESPDLVRTIGSGSVSGELELPRGGRHEIWLRGSFGRSVDISIDGRRVASVEDELSQPAGWIELGTVALGPGRHNVTLSRGGASLAPGSGDGPRTMGSLVLRAAPSGARQVVVPADGWQRLCRRPLLSAGALVPAS